MALVASAPWWVQAPAEGVGLHAALTAGLAATRGRKHKPGDGYDIEHLTRGLSRCGIVTADSGMTELCRSRGLVPSGCELLSARELDRLPAVIEAAHRASSHGRQGTR